MSQTCLTTLISAGKKIEGAAASRTTVPGFFQFALCQLRTRNLTRQEQSLYLQPKKNIWSNPPPPPHPSCSPELRPVMQMRNRCVGGWRAQCRPCFHKDPRLTRSRKSCLLSSSCSKTWILFGSSVLHETPAWEPGGGGKKHSGRNRERRREEQGGVGLTDEGNMDRCVFGDR